MSQPPHYQGQPHDPSQYARMTNRQGQQPYNAHPDSIYQRPSSQHHVLPDYGVQPGTRPGQIQQQQYAHAPNHQLYGSTYNAAQSALQWQTHNVMPSQYYPPVTYAQAQYQHPLQQQPQHQHMSHPQAMIPQMLSQPQQPPQPVYHPQYAAPSATQSRYEHTRTGPTHTLSPSLMMAGFDGTAQPADNNRSRNGATHQIDHSARSHVKPADMSPEMHSNTGPPPPKRRKSNEGVAVDQRPSIASVSKQTPQPKNKISAMPSQQASGPDLSAVLLALCEEYMHAAHSMKVETQDDTQHYQRLVATAISCLRGALQTRFHDQRKEGRIRLRLAKMLYEETEDTEEAEEVLSKGMTACEKSRLYDLKFAMQHLLICNTRSSNPKAATRMLEKSLAEVESLDLRHWQYAFLTLKITQCLQANNLIELRAGLRHLEALKELASQHNATSVRILCSCLEAMACFAAGEDIEAAQRAVADARSFQLGPEMKTMPQLESLLNCLQMISQVPHFTSEAMYTEVRRLHPAQNTLSKAPQWTKDGFFGVRLSVGKTPQHVVEDAAGIFIDSDGYLALSIKWLPSAEMMTICYTLCGIASIPKNGEKSEAEKFLQQALKINQMSSDKYKGATDLERKRQINDGVNYLLACTLAARARYSEAQQIISEVDQHHAQARFRLLSGVCEQGMGNLEEALQLYKPDVAQLQDDPERNYMPLQRDMQILACLNSVYILHRLKRDGINELLDLIEPHCLEHVNQNFKSAYHVLVATIEYPTATIMETKSRLSQALQPAQHAKNQQLLGIIMSMMTEIFFTNIVGSQAEKSAHAAYAIAAKSGDPLWKAVGLGLYRATLDRMGQEEQAIEMNVLAEKAVAALPAEVSKSLGLD